MRELKGFTGRDISDTTERDLKNFTGRALADMTSRDIRAVGSQLFPWTFPLWFSDIEPKNLSNVV